MGGPPELTFLIESRGFLPHYYIGRLLRIGFVAQCCAVAGLSAAILVMASLLDHTLFLDGRDVGLLQHPAIWAFLALQVALPLSVRRSLASFSGDDAKVREASVSVPDLRHSVAHALRRFMRLHCNWSRVAATTCYTVGLAAFVWNTYQNQLPNVLLPYDFWDSSNHMWGYWSTRLYKSYLFIWFLPYIALLHAGVLIETLKLIRRRRIDGTLKLQPFHPDEVGGLGFVPGLVTTPIAVTLLAGSLPLAGAFEVHRAIDVTPMMGTAILVFGGLVAYLIPIMCLRTDIIAMKRNTVEALRSIQADYYAKVMTTNDADPDVLHRGLEALDYFDRICVRVNAISNYPHLRRLLKTIGLAFTPSAIVVVSKLSASLASFIVSALRHP
jgi:hypothetical protein